LTDGADKLSVKPVTSKPVIIVLDLNADFPSYSISSFNDKVWCVIKNIWDQPKIYHIGFNACKIVKLA